MLIQQSMEVQWKYLLEFIHLQNDDNFMYKLPKCD